MTRGAHLSAVAAAAELSLHVPLLGVVLRCRCHRRHSCKRTTVTHAAVARCRCRGSACPASFVARCMLRVAGCALNCKHTTAITGNGLPSALGCRARACAKTVITLRVASIPVPYETAALRQWKAERTWFIGAECGSVRRLSTGIVPKDCGRRRVAGLPAIRRRAICRRGRWACARAREKWPVAVARVGEGPVVARHMLWHASSTLDPTAAAPLSLLCYSACVRACVRARACARVCVCVCVCVCV